jgi:hypothetical protein
MNSTSLLVKYKYIVAWGRYMGSMDYYILDQIELAETDKAPVDAIYRRSELANSVTARWQTVDGIQDLVLRREIIEMAEKIK